MAVSTLHVLHGVVSGSTMISQVVNARAIADIQTLVAESAGLPFPLFVGNMGQNPGLPLETTQVKTVLDTTGALTSISDLSGFNTDLYFKAVQDLGRRVADATLGHLRFRMSQAFMTLDRITAGNRTEAVASARIGCTFDGTNAPLVPAGSLALAGVPSSAEHFVAGPVFLNTVQLPGVQDITIEFNRVLMEVSGDGELYNTFAAMQSYSPVITIRTPTNPWTTYGLNGTVLTAGSFYLRKVAPTGRVADGTAEHIKFAATAGLITVDESTGGNNEQSMTTVRVTLVGANATTEPITVNTAIAITT
jgi:hypothetical protein